MKNEVDYFFIRNKKLPIFSDLIFGKLFDYKYLNSTSLKDIIIKFELKIPINKDERTIYIFNDLNKNEDVYHFSFVKKMSLKEELTLIKENTIFSENFSEYKWSIQNSPVSQNYNSYFCRLFLKKDVKIDMSLMSEKLKLHNDLLVRLNKNSKKNKRNKI